MSCFYGLYIKWKFNTKNEMIHFIRTEPITNLITLFEIAHQKREEKKIQKKIY